MVMLKRCVQNMRTGSRTIQHSNNLDRVTVIVLCYKNQDKIYRTLDSILDQKNVLIDLLVSDDASGDFDAQDIIQYLSIKSTGNIRCYSVNINEHNIGTVRHANKTAKMAETEFIKFVACSDAFYDDNSLYNLIAFAKKYDNYVISSISEVCSENSGAHLYFFPQKHRIRKILSCSPEQMFNTMCAANIISSAGTLFRKSFFENGFDESYQYLEDYPTWLTIYRNNDYIPYMQVVTAKYYVGGNSSSNGTAFDSLLLREDMLRCYEKEIFPYLDRLSFLTKQIVLYRYDLLKGKVKLRNSPIHFWVCLKKYIKLILSKIKNDS